MFERLVESNSAAQFKPRRNYFMVSTVVVGILFLTAVVISLYAEDIDLGSNEFEITELLAPVPADAPEPPKADPAPAASQAASSKLPIRNDNILRTDENPTVIPEKVSSAQPTSLSRPPGYFDIAAGTETAGAPAAGNNVGFSNGTSRGSGTGDGVESEAKSQAVTETPPPPKKVEVPKLPVSIGVANGRATHLPKPPYPAPARAVGAQGNVNVQILIDERGNVVSAKAVDGHPLLRAVAVDAAQKAKFTPTLLSNVPVKVTGIIVYKFSRN